MNKKHFLRGLALTLFALVSPTLWAYDFEVDGIYYEINNMGYLTVVKNPNSYYEGDITIPWSVNNPNNGETYYVTSIGESAFENCKKLTSITISSLNDIGYNAFADCSSLKEVNIDYLYELGGWAFYNCSSLTYINLPDGLCTIGGEAFLNCSSLWYVSIPNSVENIEVGAFQFCSSLSEIYIPDGVTTIEDFTFQDCRSLTSVTIPDGVTSIGHGAFDGCTGLTSITIPSSVTSIDEYAFERCTGTLTVNCNIDNGWFSRSQFSSVEIGCDVTTIGDFAFSNLTNITIPSNVTYIGRYAFSGCSGNLILNYNINSNFSEEWLRGSEFNNIEIAEGVTTIGNFSNWENLVSITLPTSLKNIETFAFLNCYDLTSVVIPEGVTTIGGGAFSGCTSLSSITIPNSVTNIGMDVFYNCSSLTSVTISNRITSIGFEVFSGCSSLTSVTIPNSVTSIGECAFAGCSGLRSVSIPNSVTSIGESAFGGCTNLTSISIPNSVINIGGGAFYGCTNLASISIPESVTSIGDRAFFGCLLERIDCRGTTPPTIVSGTFYDIDKTIPVYVPKTALSAYQNADYWKEFSNIQAIEQGITFADSNVKSLCVANWDTDGDGELSLEEAEKVTDLGDVFKNNKDITAFKELRYFTGLKEIGESAFDGCSGLTSIQIPNTIKTISSYAFHECAGLKSVPLPKGLTDIGEGAFEQCTGLESLNFPDSLTNIGAWSFIGCSGLSELTIPSSVDYIGFGAFFLCSGLNSIQVEGGVYDSRDNCNAIINGDLLMIGCGNTVIPDGVRSIGESAFNSSSLTSITIPEGVTEIGYSAFSFCDGLETVTLPRSMVNIEDIAFTYCTHLASISCEALTPPTIQAGTFEGVDKTIPLIVPYRALSAYRSADFWKEFTNIQSIQKVIEFADATVKSLCVDNWDTDGDGELTEEEAAAVKDLGTVFKGNKNIKTFEELSYFTGLTGISANAFQNCTALTTITVPDNVKSIGNYAFSNCKKLTNFSMPDNVSTIGTYAFQNCTALTEFTIPSGVTAISQRMFEGCNALKTVDIPNSVTTIGMFSFYGCSSLKSVIIPNSVTTIEKNVFESSGMTTLTIPNSVTTLGNSIFKNCTSVTTVICECVTPPTITYGTSIEPIPTSAVVKVPVTSLYAYQNDANWNTYTNGNMQGVLFEPYKRNVSYDWGTVVLPYTTESTEDVQLYSLKSADLTEGILRLTPENTIPANTPCIFKRLDSEATTVTFPIVEQGSTTQTTVSAATEVDGWTFKGTYNDRTLTPSATPSVYYIAEDQFQLANVAYRMAAFCGWFETAAPVNVQSFRIQTDEENPGIEDYLKGDANGDGSVDIADAVCIVNHIVGKATPAYMEAAADANGDGVVDIADAVRIVNLIVGKIDALVRKQDIGYTLPDPE